MIEIMGSFVPTLAKSIRESLKEIYGDNNNAETTEIAPLGIAGASSDDSNPNPNPNDCLHYPCQQAVDGAA